MDCATPTRSPAAGVPLTRRSEGRRFVLGACLPPTSGEGDPAHGSSLHGRFLRRRRASNSEDQNHAGYYVNPSTTESWTEGFAGFFSMMVSKHIDGDRLAHLYRVEGGLVNIELDYRAWLGLGRAEDLAVASLLLDLEDGPADYGEASEASDLLVEWSTVVDDSTYGRLVVGEVGNYTADDPDFGYVDYSQQTVAVAAFEQQGEEVYTGAALTVPSDIPGLGGRGFFAIPVPEDVTWDELTVVGSTPMHSRQPTGAIRTQVPPPLSSRPATSRHTTRRCNPQTR